MGLHILYSMTPRLRIKVLEEGESFRKYSINEYNATVVITKQTHAHHGPSTRFQRFKEDGATKNTLPNVSWTYYVTMNTLPLTFEYIIRQNIWRIAPLVRQENQIKIPSQAWVGSTTICYNLSASK